MDRSPADLNMEVDDAWIGGTCTDGGAITVAAFAEAQKKVSHLVFAFASTESVHAVPQACAKPPWSRYHGSAWPGSRPQAALLLCLSVTVSESFFPALIYSTDTLRGKTVTVQTRQAICYMGAKGPKKKHFVNKNSTGSPVWKLMYTV
jgi:hypothetical protein